jgi:hypothetical protein
MSTPIPIPEIPIAPGESRSADRVGVSLSVQQKAPGSPAEEIGADPTADARSPGKFWNLLLTGTAVGYYLSALLHVLAYSVSAVIFYLLGMSLLPEEEWVKQSIQASLDDQDVLDEAAKVELTPEIDLGTASQLSNVQQLARQLQIVDAGWIETLNADALTALAGSEDDAADAAAGSAFFFQIPKAGLAVTKGSYTAWTEPANPLPGQNYLIVIEIRLPDDVKRYRITDLVGEVVGSDNYRQKIPYDSRARSATAASTAGGLKVIDSSTVLDVTNNKVQLAVRVPGAARLVRDTIKIRSRRLREAQELVLVFGGTQKAASDDDDE